MQIKPCMLFCFKRAYAFIFLTLDFKCFQDRQEHQVLFVFPAGQNSPLCLSCSDERQIEHLIVKFWTAHFRSCRVKKFIGIGSFYDGGLKRLIKKYRSACMHSFLLFIESSVIMPFTFLKTKGLGTFFNGADIRIKTASQVILSALRSVPICRPRKYRPHTFWQWPLSQAEMRSLIADLQSKSSVLPLNLKALVFMSYARP